VLSAIGKTALRVLRRGRPVDAAPGAANDPNAPPVAQAAEVPGLHRLFPENPRYARTLALAVAQRGDFAGALALLDNLESRHGSSDEIAVARARLLAECGEHNEVIAILESRSVNSDDAFLHVLLAENYFRTGRLRDADRAYGRALALDPRSYPALASKAVTAGRLGHLDEAIECARRALRYDPRSADEWAHLHWLYGMANRFEDEAQAVDQALEIFPDSVRYIVGRGLLRLLQGDFPSGWEDFDARLRDPERYPVRRSLLERPLWRGEQLAGKTLLVFGEQGAGDNIMMTRYLPRVKALGGRVVYEVPEGLHELLDSAGGVDEWLPRHLDREPEINFDCWTPVMTLARTFGADLSSIPREVPYLSVSPEARAFWTELMGPPPADLLRVGLAWAGNPGHGNDLFRSVPTEIVAPLIGSTLGAVFYRLQLEGPRDLSHELPSLRDLTGHIITFADTAALIEQMDLVISVDTSIAHIAGALGRPTWVLLPFRPDWRWLLDRTDSPWYPTLRLFRQPKPMDWRSVVADVAVQLNDLIGRRCVSPPLLQVAR
jgi:hypothetical protein